MERKELEQQIDRIIEEVNKISSVLDKNEDISYYKSYLLELKLHILEGHYDYAINEIRKILEKENKKYNILNNFVFLGLISSFLMTFISPYIFLVLIYLTMYSCRRLETIEEDRKKEINIFEKDVNNMKKKFLSEYYLIKTKSKAVTTKVEALDNEEMKNIDLANKYIDMFLNGESIPKLSDEILKKIIQLLQRDLETEEDNVEKLLVLAKEKVLNEMILLDDFSLKRTNGCNF